MKVFEQPFAQLQQQPSLFRDIHVEAVCGESTVSDWCSISDFNDRFGDPWGNAVAVPVQVQTDAAPATCQNRMATDPAVQTYRHTWGNDGRAGQN